MKKDNNDTFKEVPNILLNLVTTVTVNNKEYANIKEWYNSLPNKNGNFVLVLNPPTKKIKVEKVQEIRIIV